MRELAGNLVTGILAVIVCEVCYKIRQYVSKLDSLSKSWTICSLVFLTKDERACMQSCYGRLGSDLDYRRFRVKKSVSIVEVSDCCS